MKKMYFLKICVVVVLMICFFGFVDSKYHNNNENDYTEQENENNTYAEMITSAYSVSYDEDGQYLLSPEGDKIAGPFLKVYSEDVSADILYCRYVDKTTELIGYIKRDDGKKMTEAKFTEASQMDTAPARVKETTGGVYYINNSFLRISNDFEEGAEFEHQGCYARVKLLETQSWAIINKKGEVIFQSENLNEKIAYINPIPYVLSMTTAKMSDGRIAILSLSSENYDSVNILFKSEEHYADISEMYFDTYALITDLNGNTGVIDYLSNIVVPLEYEKVVAKLVDSEESRFLGDIVEFTCYKNDGKQCVFIKKW